MANEIIYLCLIILLITKGFKSSLITNETHEI